MKFLITGVNGVVGKNIFQLLSQRENCEVFGCGRQPLKEENKYFVIDLLDRSSILQLFSTNYFDCVIHCAANISTDEKISFDMFYNNWVSTLNVVEGSLASGVKKIFYTSSIPIIGDILEVPITEEHKIQPKTKYHLSKIQSEQIIEKYCEGKIDFINMRIPSPVGLHMPLRSVFPIFLDKIRNNKNITLVGNPQREQNFLDLRDLESFIYNACFIRGVSGVFNVAAKRTYTNLELANIMISKLSSCSKIEDKMNKYPEKIERWDISIKKAEEYFGFYSKYDIEDTIDWILES